MILSGDDKKCCSCGRKRLREPKENDPLYLTAQNTVFSGTVEDILTKNNIPYMRRGKLGGSPWTAPQQLLTFFNEYDFFVPYGAHEKAKEVLGDFLGKMG